VVDIRSDSSETVPIEDTRDKLTKHGDKEEGKFIEGVTSVHGPDQF
jgi:hypothetical protein